MSVAQGSQQDAIDSVLDLWDPVKHPRGRDGKFIETGAFVQVFDGPGGPQIASGKVTAAYKAPDGRTFVGIDVGGGKIVWHRPKQIESVEVKGWIGPKPKDSDSGEKPATPLPSVPEKYEEIHWEDSPDYDPNALTEAAVEHDAGWSPMVQKLVPWLTESGFDPMTHDVYSEVTENYSLIHVSNPDGGHDSYNLSDKTFVEKHDDSDDLWATMKLGIAELLHDHEQPNGIPETETVPIVMDVPWHHPANWEGWLQAVGFTPSMTSVYASEGNPEQLLITDGINAYIYQKGHEYSDIPLEVAQWAVASGTGSGAYKQVFDPEEHKAALDFEMQAEAAAQDAFEKAGVKTQPEPENPFWMSWLKQIGAPPNSSVYVVPDTGFVIVAEPHSMEGVEYNGDLEKTGETITVQDLADGSMDGEMTVVWPPLEFAEEDFSEPDEGWANWLHDRALSSTSNKVYVSSTGSIFVETDGADFLKQFVLESKEPVDWDGGIPVISAPEFVESGDWTAVWPKPELDIDFGELPPDDAPDSVVVQGWLDEYNLNAEGVYQYPGQESVYVPIKNGNGAMYVFPGGILSDQFELSQMDASEVTDPSSEATKIWGPANPQDTLKQVAQGVGPLEEWEKELMESVPEPSILPPAPTGLLIKIPIAGLAGLPGGSEIYTHPQGSTITVTPYGDVQKWNAQGKKAATSADALKLAQGHGQWKHAATTTGNGVNVVMHTEQGDQLGNYDTLLDGLKLADVQPGDSAVPSPTGSEATFPNIGKGPEGVWLSATGDAAWVKVGGEMWFATPGALAWTPASTSPQFLDADPEIVKAQYIAGPPGTETGAEVIPFEPATILDSPPPAPAGPPPIKIPKGKTAEDLLWMIAISYKNKNPDDIAAQSGFGNELAAALSMSTGYDAALKKLNSLMTIAKLGGKQRARYKTLLQMHYGVQPAPGSSEQSAVPGDPGKWQLIKPPGGYTSGVTSFVTGNALISTGGATAGTAKANIQENLSKRLVGRVTMDQMLAAVHDTEFNSSNDLVDLANLAKSWTPQKGGYLSKGGHLGIWKWQAGKGGNVTIPASKENLERALRESLTSQLVQIWAGTSNDTNPRSLAMQHAAEVEFGLKNCHQWATTKTATKKEYDKHGPLFRQFLRVMYENTQDWAKANGVTKVKLKRGMNYTANAAGALVGQDHDVQLRPMSSFTTNSSTASGFGSGYVIEAVVPIEWIIGTAATGFGCQSEYEWVILGGIHKMRRVA